jgi:hypothetical protein
VSGRLTSAAHEDVPRTAVEKSQPTFEQQWVVVMLTSSTAEPCTLRADYEIGLQLEPQEVHPRVRYGAHRSGRPGHMSFGQTWSASKGAMNNIDYATVQIAPAEAVRRRKMALHGNRVSLPRVDKHARHVRSRHLSWRRDCDRRNGAIDNPELRKKTHAGAGRSRFP